MLGIHFCPKAALLECGHLPLNDSFRDECGETESYSRILPQYVCGYNSDFYLQFTLNEFSLGLFSAEHQRKSTLIKMARESERKRFVPALGKELPVLVASIIVNRDEFPPAAANEDRIEWLTKLTPRTKGICHEILYAQQYLENYDWNASTVERPVFRFPILPPSVDQEDNLLCTDTEIERFLHTIEGEFGIELKTLTQFKEVEQTDPVTAYHRIWLSDRGVERDVCHRRTEKFLEGHHRGEIAEIIRACLKRAFPQEQLHLQGFSSAKSRETEHYLEFKELVRQNGNGHVAEEVVCLIAARYLK